MGTRWDINPHGNFMLFEKETIDNVVMNFMGKICTDIGNVVREICGFT